MTALLDTNILVRHFTDQPPTQARRAATLLRQAQHGEFILVDLVAAELVFVLQSVYQRSRAHIATMLRSASRLPAIHCKHASLLCRNLDLYIAGDVTIDSCYPCGHSNEVSQRSGRREQASREEHTMTEEPKDETESAPP